MALGLLTGALVSAVIEKVVDVASTHLGGYFKERKGMGEELRRLNMLLPQIQSVVDAAESGGQQTSGPLKKWLWQLKDAVYEADDVLDELDYLQLKKQAGADVRLAKRIKIFRPDPTLDMLSGVVRKLEELAAGAGIFVQLLSNVQRDLQQQGKQAIFNRITGPLLTENKVFGREEEREKLLGWLTTMPADHKDESNMGVSLFSVVGHGGMGKTTLAQLVFNDDTVKQSFDLKIWVCVSTPFDVKGLTRSILEGATKERPKVDGLPALQDALKEKLKTSGKFLLVLDDVWNDDDLSSWQNLLAPLRCGRNGSKILLTTRMDRVAHMAVQAMGASTMEPLKLGGLYGEDFSSLFNRYAFAGVDLKNYPNLQDIGMQIVQRIGNSPLAAKTVGGLLNSNLNDRYWINILHSENISDRAQHGKDNITSILKLSYHHLPPHLRPCFAYCGMFPKDHEFRKKDLILMWMAGGFIQHSDQNQGEMLEDVGGAYFDELLRRSLLDHKTYVDGDYYVMHDLLHDLTQFVSHGECYSFVDDDKNVERIIPNTVRHLYVESDKLDFLTKMDNWHNLRSLVLRIKVEQSKHSSALEKVFKSLKSIRMLNVDLGWEDATMPDTFSHLIHLRRLKIVSSRLLEFPRSLCKLYHLQDIRFEYEEDTIKLPESINKLVNLRHLSANHLVVGVGKLIFLQDLFFFVKKEKGYKIGELRDLNCLHNLKIKGLENVENQEEASAIKLCNKKYLQTLYLGWGVSGDTGMDKHERVLDSLQPHSNLKELKIKGYRGIRYANWMGFELINNLQSICFSNCSRLDRLPPFGHYLTALRELEIKNCPELVDFHSVGLQHLRALYELKIENCPKLQVAPDPIVPDGNDEKFLPPSLRSLVIEGCDELVRSLPVLLKGFVSLDKLWLKDCEELMSLESLMGLQSIRSLEIRGCQKLLHVAGTDTFFTLVEELWIDDPLLLVSGVLRSLTSVQSLHIMELGGMEDMSILEQWLLQNQTTVEMIYIYRASSLKSLPDSLKILSSLKSLLIYDVSEGLRERCRKDIGADWPIISHIRRIVIYGPGFGEGLNYEN